MVMAVNTHVYSQRGSDCNNTVYKSPSIPFPRIHIMFRLCAFDYGKDGLTAPGRAVLCSTRGIIPECVRLRAVLLSELTVEICGGQ